MTLEEIAANVSRKYRTSQSMVADGLREAILSGVLQEGQPLRQAEIANLFGVSRVPVREALRQLEGEGLVISHAHRGAVVSTLSHDEIREITEMRIALETLAIRTAMEHITKDDLQHAEKALDAIDREKNLAAKWADHDWAFHASLYSPSGWTRLLASIKTQHRNFDRFICVHLDLTDYRKKAQQEHRRLLELCRVRKVKPAVDLLSSHIRDIGEIVFSQVEEAPENQPDEKMSAREK